jgi:hypothetical protein
VSAHEPREPITSPPSSISIARRSLGPARRRSAAVGRKFEQAASAWRAQGRAHFVGIYERANELAMAKFLLTDPRIANAMIQHESDIPDRARFDFVVPDYEGATLCVELKTVHPQIPMTIG